MIENPAIREFITNEASFINNMSEFLRLYIRPMLKSGDISHDDRRVLSEYADTIEALNSSYENLDIANCGSDDEFLDRLNSNHFREHAQNIIPLCLKVNEIQQVYDRQVSPPAYPNAEEPSAQMFVSYPIMPVQRTTRYKMTLSEALRKENKRCDANKSKVDKIEKIIKEAHSINIELNTRQARIEGHNKALQDCNKYVDVKRKQQSKQKWGMRLILTQPTTANRNEVNETDEYIKTILTTVFSDNFVRKNGNVHFKDQHAIQQTPINLDDIDSLSVVGEVDEDLYNVLVASARQGSCDSQTQLNALTYSLDLLTNNRLGKRTQSPIAKELLSKAESVAADSPEADKIRQVEEQITTKEGRPFSQKAFSAIRSFTGTAFGSPSSRTSSRASNTSLDSESSDTIDEIEQENQHPNTKRNTTR